ncbi:MAG: PIN domain-containing protein [Bryobacter sp.]|nr:PIN domain-containing protein [Bryobacter sp.]
MKGKFFLDTNLLIYALDGNDPQKQFIAQNWLAKAHASGEGVLSYQVVQEWFNVVLKKAAVPLNAKEATVFYDSLIAPLWRIHSSKELLKIALDIYSKDKLSWWDSLIVGAALMADCKTLFSEDLQHGRFIYGLKIINPFLPTAKN